LIPIATPAAIATAFAIAAAATEPTLVPIATLAAVATAFAIAAAGAEATLVPIATPAAVATALAIATAATEATLVPIATAAAVATALAIATAATEATLVPIATPAAVATALAIATPAAEATLVPIATAATEATALAIATPAAEATLVPIATAATEASTVSIATAAAVATALAIAAAATEATLVPIITTAAEASTVSIATAAAVATAFAIAATAAEASLVPIATAAAPVVSALAAERAPATAVTFPLRSIAAVVPAIAGTLAIGALLPIVVGAIVGSHTARPTVVVRIPALEARAGTMAAAVFTARGFGSSRGPRVSLVVTRPSIVAVVARAPALGAPADRGEARAALAALLFAPAALGLLLGVLARSPGEEPLDHQSGIGTAGQLETQTHLAQAVVLGVGLRGAHAQVLGAHEQRSILALEMEARHVLHSQVRGDHALRGQHVAIEFPVFLDRDVLETFPRQAQGSLGAQVSRAFVRRHDQGTFDGIEYDTLLEGKSFAQIVGRGAVPQVRLVRKQMDQAQPLPHEREGSNEVVGVLLEMLEQRAVLAVARGQASALAPVPPVLLQAFLEALGVGRLVLRDRKEQGPQGGLHLALEEQVQDPALTVAQVAEALIVEVVDHADVAHDREVATQGVQLRPIQCAGGDLERVAAAVRAGELAIHTPNGLDAQLRRLEVHRASAGHAHVLDRHPLPVLEPRHGHLGRLDSGFPCEHARRLR
jgi:hypothetical protein